MEALALSLSRRQVCLQNALMKIPICLFTYTFSTHKLCAYFEAVYSLFIFDPVWGSCPVCRCPGHDDAKVKVPEVRATGSSHPAGTECQRMVRKHVYRWLLIWNLNFVHVVRVWWEIDGYILILFRLIDWFTTHLFTLWLFDWLLDWLIDWLIAWMIDRLIDWLIDGLTNFLSMEIGWLMLWFMAGGITLNAVWWKRTSDRVFEVGPGRISKLIEKSCAATVYFTRPN